MIDKNNQDSEEYKFPDNNKPRSRAYLVSFIPASLWILYYLMQKKLFLSWEGLRQELL